MPSSYETPSVAISIINKERNNSEIPHKDAPIHE
jgi:hypothetical protein